MKKLLVGVVAVLCCFGAVFAGCGQNNNETISGEFYTVEEAYKNGLLKYDDLLNIAYLHDNERDFNKDLNKDVIGEDFVSAQKSPAKLSEETENAIKQCYCDKHIYDEDITISDLGVVYYGTYNECVAIMVWVNNGAYATEVIDDVVDGIHFWYPNSNTMLIWKKHRREVK